MISSTISNDVVQFTVIDKYCDVKSALSLPDIKIGHFLKFSFANQALEADIPVWDPQNFNKIINVVAIIENIRWNGLANSPIEVRGRVSSKNKALMQECICSSDGRFECEAAWVVYEYDYDAGRYYRSFHTDEKTVNLKLYQFYEFSREPDSSIKTPVNYSFDLSFAANSEIGDQKLFFAFSASGKTFSRAFGSE